MGAWYEEVFDDRVRIGLRTERTLVSRQSTFQKIELFETQAYGRALALDGLMMTSERDEYFYHEMIAHLPLCMVKAPRDVLIIGGGDGGTAREVLKHPTVERVVMVEIDGDVVDVCREYLPQIGAWDDVRLDVRIEDGIAFAQRAPDAAYDVVLLDGSDPVGPAAGLFNAAFYADVRRVLRPHGVFGLQSESPILQSRVFAEVQVTLESVFEKVRPYFGLVPLYAGGSTWSWTVASAAADLTTWDESRLAELEPGLKYLNRDVARGAFAQPGYVQQLIAAARRGEPTPGVLSPLPDPPTTGAGRAPDAERVPPPRPLAGGPSAESAAGAQADPSQYHRQRAETGERRLKQVETDEGGQEKEARVDELAQNQAHEHHETGESQDEAIDVHGASLAPSARF